MKHRHRYFCLWIFADLQTLSKNYKLNLEGRNEVNDTGYAAKIIFNVPFRVYYHVTKLTLATLNISCFKEKHILQKLTKIGLIKTYKSGNEAYLLVAKNILYTKKILATKLQSRHYFLKRKFVLLLVLVFCNLLRKMEFLWNSFYECVPWWFDSCFVSMKMEILNHKYALKLFNISFYLLISQTPPGFW